MIKLIAAPLLAVGLAACVSAPLDHHLANPAAPGGISRRPCRGAVVQVFWPNNMRPTCRPRPGQNLQIIYPLNVDYEAVVTTINLEHQCGTTATPPPQRWMGDHCEWL